MVREIVKDTKELTEKCETVFFKTKSLPEIITDLKDSAIFYENLENNPQGCLGLAANQIGYKVRAIICHLKINDKDKWIIMINPCITKRVGRVIESEEGCLSIEGTRITRRYEGVHIKYLDENMKPKTIKLFGLNAIVAQHEIDHTNGKLI